MYVCTKAPRRHVHSTTRMNKEFNTVRVYTIHQSTFTQINRYLVMLSVNYCDTTPCGKCLRSTHSLNKDVSWSIAYSNLYTMSSVPSLLWPMSLAMSTTIKPIFLSTLECMQFTNTTVYSKTVTSTEYCLRAPAHSLTKQRPSLSSLHSTKGI